MARGTIRIVSLLVALLLVICWSGDNVEAKKSRKKKEVLLKGNEKLAQLQDHVKNGVISFTNEIYGRYALRPDRPYHLVLLFTVSGAKFKCDICKLVLPEFELLGLSYEAAKQIKVDTRDGLEIFFGVVDYSANEDVFKRFDYTSAPHIVYVAPDRSFDAGEVMPKKFKVETQNFYNVHSQSSSADALALFVKQRTGFEIYVQRSKTTLYLFLVLALALAALIAKLVLAHLDLVLAKLRRKQLWMTVSLLFYGLSVSGMVYCIIRKPPPFASDRAGNIQYFHPQGRQQFIYEGLIVGGYDIAAAIFIILLSQWTLYLRNPIVRYLSIVGCTLGFVLMYRQMTSAYKFKNRWYTGWMGI
ncbi:magnesium transporter protein 1-like [Plasmopara halstedii]|uniref:Magnesium transporter protein 1-like n=1 Tax=Plasmopara halstedii TaxID=4781 RepID=A0A0P1AWF5_PLAHL|nr:magnesium transporter protein 1-like [Plasmopara halstedii]CEG46334.1 magnesium transporter protein 1-like [Plasmopara halstedii]|eukprot:XP_024582703.1 magnesium transporter protein 1-like [Plasmopara halstedii]